MSHTPSTQKFIDLAQERLGGKVIACSDDFFASMHNLIKPGRGEALPGYNDRGKIMDGWESRRKRTPGHDWCIVRLGSRGRIYRVDIDTNHFTGNYPEFASLEACTMAVDQEPTADGKYWQTILPSQRLKGSSQNFFDIESTNNVEFTHVKLNIFPDGGVARLKIYGLVSISSERLLSASSNGASSLDLALVTNGGRAYSCSDEHYGTMHNINMPETRGINMGDGWETRRRRGPGFDWLILKLGATCSCIDKIIVDTAHFKGNYPDECSVEATYVENEQDEVLLDCMTSCGWFEVLPKQKLQADTVHTFGSDVLKKDAKDRKINFVRLCIYPDGGVSRLRVFGKPLLP